MRSEKLRKKKILFVGLLLFFLLANVFLSNLIFNQKSHINDNQDDDNDYIRNDFQDNSLKKQDLSSDNIFSGIGAPWNVTQLANRTDSNLVGRFNGDSYDIVEIPLESGWEGYRLEANIKNLYDTRNWSNGTFTFAISNPIITFFNIKSVSGNTSFIRNGKNYSFKRKPLFSGF